MRNTKRTDGRHTTKKMHQHILSGAKEIDHKNGNGLDNRRENLRSVSRAENQQNRRGLNANNTSGFIGVSPEGNRWRATIRVSGHQRHLGYFDTAEEAAQARDFATREAFGDFARLNFSDERMEIAA